MWNTLGPDIVSFAQNCCETKFSLDKINKRLHLQVINDFQRICLYNVIYKLISKVVANKIKFSHK